MKDELKELGETEAVLASDTEAGDGLTVQLRLPETESGACVSDSLWQHWREIATSPSVAVLIMGVEKFCLYIYTEFLSNVPLAPPLQREARLRLCRRRGPQSEQCGYLYI